MFIECPAGAPETGMLRIPNSSDCNGTCNVEHIQRYTFRYSKSLRDSKSLKLPREVPNLQSKFDFKVF